MTDLDTFLWGSAGGAVAFLILFLLPELRTAAVKGAPPAFNLVRVVVFLILWATYALIGGVAAFVIGDATEIKHALTYGMAGETLLAGLVKPSDPAVPQVNR